MRVEWEAEAPKEAFFVPIACCLLEKDIASIPLLARSLTLTVANASPLSDEQMRDSGLAFAWHSRSANMKDYTMDVLDEHSSHWSSWWLSRTDFVLGS